MRFGDNAMRFEDNAMNINAALRLYGDVSQFINHTKKSAK